MAKRYLASVEIDLRDIQDDVIAYAAENLSPEDVFSYEDLRAWALENEFTETK